MNALMKLLKKERNEYIVIALMTSFILFDVKVPGLVANAVDTLVGRVIVIALAASLLMVHPVLGVVSLIAAYELINRSEKSTGTYQKRQYLPSGANKDKHLTAFNQFPLTLEEELVHKMVPFVQEGSSMPSSYKPVQDKLHQASQL